MELKLKFAFGQTVYFIMDSVIHKSEVCKITVTVNAESTVVVYDTKNRPGYRYNDHWTDDKDTPASLFASVGELTDYLVENKVDCIPV